MKPVIFVMCSEGNDVYQDERGEGDLRRSRPGCDDEAVDDSRWVRRQSADDRRKISLALTVNRLCILA